MSEICPYCGAEMVAVEGLSSAGHEEDERGNTVADLYTEYRHCIGEIEHTQALTWRDEPPTDFGQGAAPDGDWEDMAPYKLYSQWPQAHNARYAGRCDICHAPALYSFQLADDHPRGDSEETCGYWCAACGWSNAGSRAVQP